MQSRFNSVGVSCSAMSDVANIAQTTNACWQQTANQRMVVIDGKSVLDRNPITTSFHDSIVAIGSSKMNLDRRFQSLSEYQGSRL
jgi:hypothetical protein